MLRPLAVAFRILVLNFIEFTFFAVFTQADDDTETESQNNDNFEGPDGPRGNLNNMDRSDSSTMNSVAQVTLLFSKLVTFMSRLNQIYKQSTMRSGRTMIFW